MASENGPRRGACDARSHRNNSAVDGGSDLITQNSADSKAVIGAMRRSLAQARSPELRARLETALASLVKEGG
jgi:hypothetical protein